MTYVLLAEAGQFVTVDGQAVIVAVLVESTVEVMNWVVSTSLDA